MIVAPTLLQSGRETQPWLRLNGELQNFVLDTALLDLTYKFSTTKKNCTVADYIKNWSYHKIYKFWIKKHQTLIFKNLSGVDLGLKLFNNSKIYIFIEQIVKLSCNWLGLFSASEFITEFRYQTRMLLYAAEVCRNFFHFSNTLVLLFIVKHFHYPIQQFIQFVNAVVQGKPKLNSWNSYWSYWQTETASIQPSPHPLTKTFIFIVI